jgi:hypothetical protein
MSDNEVEEYKKINKDIYAINLKNWYYFRNSNTPIAIQNLFLKSNQFIYRFSIITNIDTIDFSDFETNFFDNNKLFNNRFMHHRLNYLTDNIQGYPIFLFQYNDGISNVNSWSVYNEYQLRLKNRKCFFDTSTYFTGTGFNYLINNNKDSKGSWANDLFVKFPGIPDSFKKGIRKFGKLKLEKIIYNLSLLALYSEEEISKLSNISVKPIK